MMDIARLEEGGVNYRKGVDRFLGDAELYEQVLISFLNSDLLARAQKAYEARDCRGLFRCAHEMKGASGNADMEELYLVSCALTELLRNKEPDAAALDAAFIRFGDTYETAMNAIREASEN